MTKNPLLTKLLNLVGFTLVLTSLIGLSLNVQARNAALIVDTSCAAGTDPTCIGQIPSNLTRTFSFFFSYGSVNNPEVTNAIGKVTIDNPSLELVNTASEDWYNGDAANASASVPAAISCSDAYTGNKYQILPSLVSTTSLTYGLQSARNTAAASGATTVDKLLAGRTGCLKITLKVGANATVGQTVNVSFDEDFGPNGSGSPSFTDTTRPRIQTFKFVIGAAIVSSSSSVVSSSSSSISSSRSSSVSSSTVVQDVPRSGGPGMLAIVSLGAFGVILFVAHKISKKRISEKDVQ
ncbi:MAG: hypothetical protein WCK98_07135 [bacterium]